MRAQRVREYEASHSDPVRDEARAAAVEALAAHSGVLLSLTSDQLREVTSGDLGPNQEIGLTGQR